MDGVSAPPIGFEVQSLGAERVPYLVIDCVTIQAVSAALGWTGWTGQEPRRLIAEAR